ncbi:hypothetical protein [Bacillus amyloliquefaciens]|uniref:hypothetical protein n=1 Tax=Bacillus amyloliquefaciens TaxID=1390 RepID=UPI002DBD9ADE|nr:hypothetical protein [Bacillus amyloliquefaciens]MEC3841538.1 hypothetical protein [Bacillus amyloliquefaciens]
MKHLYKVRDYIFLTHFKKVVQLKKDHMVRTAYDAKTAVRPATGEEIKKYQRKGDKYDVEIDR